MNERYSFEKENYQVRIVDNDEHKTYEIQDDEVIMELCDLLNRKEHQIHHLEQIVAWFTGLLKFYDVNGDKQ